MDYLFKLHDHVTNYSFKYKNWLIVIGLVLIAGNWYSHQQIAQQRQRDVVANPEPFDVYIVDVDKYVENDYPQSQFKVYQIQRVHSDTVEFKVGRYSYNKYRDIKRGIQLNQLMGDNYFMSETQTWPKDDLTSYLSKGLIFEVHRPIDIFVMGGIVRQRPRPVLEMAKPLLDKDNQRAIRLYQIGEYEEARAAFKLAADKGDSWGQYNFAQMLRDGVGGEVDNLAAIKWFKKSHERGHPNAQEELEALCKQTLLCTLEKGHEQI
ncbi:hypothetical protein PALB_9470 [Pseudoalteromonas luteoviolacea B = ATCC 29581]|nr:hypothetical protein PALB_9470 [Pseudoalteromonas luteoviolacea B = ATCC 29581]